MSLSKHHPYHHEISRNISKLTVHSLFFFFFFFRRNKPWFSIKNKKEIKYSNHQPSCCLLSLSFHTLMSYLLKPGRALGTKGSFLKEVLFLRCVWWIHCFSIHRVWSFFRNKFHGLLQDSDGFFHDSKFHLAPFHSQFFKINSPYGLDEFLST